jgi:hypothetical protein
MRENAWFAAGFRVAVKFSNFPLSFFGRLGNILIVLRIYPAGKPTNELPL